jgi:hypothetical protein
MIGTVQEVGRTKNGKAKIKIAGSWIFAGKCPTAGIFAGQSIEYFTSQFEATDGTMLTGLESWAPAKDGAVAAPTQQHGGMSPGTGQGALAPSQAASAPTPKGLDEAQLRFVSNCVGSAIAAGTIKNPADIGAWFHAAKGVVLS